MTTRRGFLAAFLAASTVPAFGWAAAGSPAFLAAAREPDGAFALFGLREDGSDAFRIPLPARGHAGAGHPTRAEAVAFARRPGAFALVINCINGAVLNRLTPPDGQQFNGHGVFSGDGSLLFTSEQRGDTSEGVIGVWDVADGYARLREMATGGLGPHDLRLMSDGTTLVVANGGIATDPTDRRKLNIGSMQPNLAYLDADGAMREQVTLAPDLHRNSIRHLALRADGLVAFAMQWEGEAGMTAPLVGLHRPGSTPVLASAPEAEQIAMNGYAGSIAFSARTDEVAISSPRGNRLHRFATDGTFLGAVQRRDVCGVAAGAQGFIATDGLGGVIAVDGGRARALVRAERAWDNHLVRLDL